MISLTTWLTGGLAGLLTDAAGLGAGCGDGGRSAAAELEGGLRWGSGGRLGGRAPSWTGVPSSLRICMFQNGM